MLGYTSIHISSSEIRHITLHLFGFYVGKTDYFWDSAQAFEFNLSHSVLQQSYFIKKLLNNRVCLFSSNNINFSYSVQQYSCHLCLFRSNKIPLIPIFSFLFYLSLRIRAKNLVTQALKGEVS